MWWKRGERPRGLNDQRFAYAYIFGAAKMGSDEAFALVIPEVNTAAMQEFLDRLSETLPRDEIALMYVDRAGWHGAKKLRVPDNVMLLHIPPYAP